MKVIKLVNLPISQSGSGNTCLIADGVNLAVEYEYKIQGKDMIGKLVFGGIIAYRFRNEMHSQGYMSEAYESLAKIDDSSWKKELAMMEPPSIHDLKNAQHFVLFLSSNGYFEVIAENWEARDAREGRLTLENILN